MPGGNQVIIIQKQAVTAVGGVQRCIGRFGAIALPTRANPLRARAAGSLQPRRGIVHTMCGHDDQFDARIGLGPDAGNRLFQHRISDGAHKHTDQWQVFRQNRLMSGVKKQGVQCWDQGGPALAGQGQPLEAFCGQGVGPERHGPEMVACGDARAIGLC